MLKKIFHIDNLAISLISCIFYGLGFFYASFFGLKKGWCTLVSVIVGTFGETLAKKIVYSRFIQRNSVHVVVVFIIVYFGFIIANIISISYIGYSFTSDFLSSFFWSCGISLFTFIITMIKKELTAYKIIQKQGSGKEGIVLDGEDIKLFIKDNTDTDEVIPDKYLLEVTTKTGTYYTSKKYAYKKVIAFQNIRYAEEIDRWKRAEKKKESKERIKATCFGPSLLQPDRKSNILLYHQQSEDALSLNVFKKLDADEKLPVIVCFHGSDFESGGSANPLYTGYCFVKENDCIYITVNYRFGVLGFVDFSEVPGSDDYKDAPYLGLYDQLLALEWIKENVEFFGGDKDNITVFANSLSAQCMVLLASINKLDGLVNKVNVISPLLSFLEDGTNMKKVTSALMEKFACHNMNDLLGLTTDQLKEFINTYDGSFNGPLVGGDLIPNNIYEEFSNGASKKIKFLIGINSEGYGQAVMLYGKEFADQLLETFINETAVEANDKYLYRSYKEFTEYSMKNGMSKEEAIEDLENYIYNILPSVLLAQMITIGGGEAYLYIWNEKAVVKDFGSSSYSLILAILNNDFVASRVGVINSTDSSKMIRRMTFNFASNGDPSLQRGDMLHVSPIKFSPCEKGKLNIALFEKNHVTFEDASIIYKIKILENELKDIVLYRSR